jgi:hypothetical protein
LNTLATLALFTTAGCAPTVIDPANEAPSNDEGTVPGGSSSGPTGSTGSSGSGDATTAIAMLYKDLPADPTSPGVPIGGVDPNALVIAWSNAPEACAAPYATPSSTDLVWQGALVLPPEVLAVGTVDLASVGASAFTYIYFPDSAGGGGGGGGGPDASGTLEVVSIDATSITVNLVTPFAASPASTANGTSYPSVMLQGTYTIPRC